MEGSSCYREIFQDLTLTTGPISSLEALERSVVLSEHQVDSPDRASTLDDRGLKADRYEVISVGDICLFCRRDVLETILDGIVRFGNWQEQGVALNKHGEPIDSAGRPFSSPNCQRDDIRTIFKTRAEEWLIEVARRKLQGD